MTGIRHVFAICVFAAALVPGSSLLAADDNDPQAKLRDALRNAITQVRSLEDERAALQAKQAESDQTIADLKAKVDALSKQVAGPDTFKKADVEKMAADFNQKLEAEAATVSQLNGTLDKLKAAYNDAAKAAQAKEADRAKAAGERDNFWKRATTCEAKNVQLYTVGNQILDRLKAISVGEALGSFEPFVGAKRVELQNLAQDFQDKLLDQKVSP